MIFPDPSVRSVNTNVLLSDLTNGLATLKNEQEPTMYVFPEATLLSLADNSTLMQADLRQASEMQTAVCVFEVIGGESPDPILYTNDIENFRNGTGSKVLNYGTWCPYCRLDRLCCFVIATIFASSVIDLWSSIEESRAGFNSFTRAFYFLPSL